MAIHPDAVMIGESTDKSIPFVVSNRPAEIIKHRQLLKGKTIFHMSNNGTRRVYEALSRGADPLYAVCFGNLTSFTQFISETKISHINIIPSGGSEDRFVKIGKTDLPEDRYCADSLASILSGKKISFNHIIRQVQEQLPRYYGDDITTREFSYVFAPPRSFNTIPKYAKLPNGLIEVADAQKIFPIAKIGGKARPIIIHQNILNSRCHLFFVCFTAE